MQTNATHLEIQEQMDNKDRTVIHPLSKIVSAILWAAFLCSGGYLVYHFPNIPVLKWGPAFKIYGFTLLIWTVVSFFGALVSSYASRYLTGFRYQGQFMLRCLGFTLSVMLLVMSDHLLPLLLSWLLMGFFMSRLIGVNSDWNEAREASKLALRFFLTGTGLLSIGLLLPAFLTDTFLVSELVQSLDSLHPVVLLIAALCLITASIIQSAIYPFHRWLLSAMTAPTPASALMHAGFVNGAGIILAIFSTLIFASNTLDLLLIIGGLTAIIAQFTKLLQVNVKQKLACSTIAQMGFMIMQCGLGFFNAAVAHLILHGFYKAYLFLSSGEEIAHSTPQKPPHIHIKPLQALAVLIFGILGALLFITLTGKELAADSSIFLTLIVSITVGQVTYNIVKQKSLHPVQKVIVPTLLFAAGIGAYALLYNGITVLMSDMPLVAGPVPLSATQIIFGLIFLLGFFIMKLGLYRKAPWLYVKLMNISQPFKSTIFTENSKTA